MTMDTDGMEASEGPRASELGATDSFDVEGMPRYALLPGDPNRVSIMADQWDTGATESILRRNFRAAVGTYRGAAIGAVSTGVGGPSAENVITRLAINGVDTFIRVGTTGAIREDIGIGDIVINDASVRMDGVSALYVRPEYPAAASYDVTLALIQAAENIGVTYHVGTGYTAGSFFAGQFRASYGGYKPSRLEGEFDEMKQARVTNFEMEGSALFTLSRIFGVRAGMCAAVVANRLTGEWEEKPSGVANACLVGAEAVRILTEWDRKRESSGRAYFFPGLITGDA